MTLQKITAFKDDIVALRRQYHRQPELGLEEYKTSVSVAEHLKLWGYEVTTRMATTGVVGTLKVGGGGKMLGLRADMDALDCRSSQRPPQFEG